MVDSTQFDLSQIADVVNRSKISDKRKRNEMMRLGTSDPNSFAMQNQQQIQEAKQPQEFWGAGRKIASNQNPDVAAANLVGGLYNLGGEYNYYGDKDTSTAQFGTKGYQTKDLGGGAYDILNQAGTSLGTGYGSVADAINAYRKSNALSQVKEIRPTEQQLPIPGIDRLFKTQWSLPTNTNEPSLFDTREAAEAEALKSYTPYQSRATGFGGLEDWEVLGQLLNAPNRTSQFSDLVQRPDRIPGNNQAETIVGLNTLFGSQPLIWNNQLKGYVMDPTPADPTKPGYRDPYSAGLFDTTGTTQSTQYLGRKYNDMDKWRQLGRPVNENQFYVPTENAAQLPGWQQSDVNKRQHASNSLFGNVFNVLDPVLDKLDPLHDPTQDAIVNLLGTDTQKQAFETVAPIVANFFGGWGSLLNVANSLSTGDLGGAAISGIGAGTQFSGQGSPTNYLGTQFKDMGMSPTVANAAANFTTNALTNAARGGDLKSILGSALFGAAGGAAGDALAKATQGYLGDIGSNMLGGAASGSINSLFSKNSPIAGSLYGAMSGGLHGFLNSTSKSGNQFNQQVDSNNKQKAQALAKLFKQAVNNRNK